MGTARKRAHHRSITAALSLGKPCNEPKVMKIAELPVKVRQTMQREAGAGVISEIEKSEEKTTYTTEIAIGMRRYRITVDADGLLLTKEYVGEVEEK